MRAPARENHAAVNLRSCPAHMAFIVRIDTWETIGYFDDLKGPLPAGANGCIFDAWRHPDGRLRYEPFPWPL